MSHSSARKAQVEPLPALVAVLAVCLAVGAYATVGERVVPRSGHGPPVDAVLDDTVDAATPEGMTAVVPSTVTVDGVAPAGYRVVVTVTAGDREWNAGPGTPPPDAASATTRVPVRVENDQVRPGHLSVEVWQ